MQLSINATTYTVSDTDPDRLLLWVLRDELGLTGTKYGCGAGICGACTVHVNGAATRACQTKLSAVATADLRTIEGLATTDAAGAVQLHPVQQAFVEAQAPQCSWCMSGQMMTAAAFLAQTPNPSEAEMLEAMNHNYCRCGCYARIKIAVLRAAELAREKAAV